MTSDERERLAVLVERRLAGLLGPEETAELTRLLETSGEARQYYLRAVELHLDLQSMDLGRAVAPGRQRRQGVLGTVIGVAAAALIAAGVYLGLSKGNPPPDGPMDRRISSEVPTLKPPAPPPPPPPLYNANQIQELRREVYAGIWLINMTTLISESMRFRNLTNEYARLQADIARHDSKIKDSLEELGKVGEKLALEPYLGPGDQILGFVDKDFTTLKPGEAAQVLHDWVRNWRAGPTLVQVNLARGDKKMMVYLQFPEETQELLALVRHPALGDIAAMVAIPADLLQDVQGRFDALPPGYRSLLIPVEQRRLEELLRTKRGSSDDVEWLRTRLLAEVILSFQREADTIRSKVLELEPRLKDNVATDVIYRKNGPKLEGQIIQETEEFVKVKSRFGSVTLQKTEIEKIERGRGAAAEFPGKLAEAKGSLDKLVPLLAWCTEKGLKLEKEYVAFVILTLNASNEKARVAAGLSRPTIGPRSMGPK